MNFKDKINVTAFKGNYGHTFSASGIVETIMSINMLKSQKLTPICNFQETDIVNDCVEFIT